MGDFNINILNCDSDKDTSGFVYTIPMHPHYTPPLTLLHTNYTNLKSSY